MKKAISILLVVFALLFVGATATACFHDDGVKLTSITLEKEEAIVDIDEEFTINYVIEPEDGEILVNLRTNELYDDNKEDVFEIKEIQDGSCKIKGVTAGTWTLRIRDARNEQMYADCLVTVNAPEGYTVKSGNDFKLAYPSNWSTVTVVGADFSCIDNSTGANINVISMDKNPAYFDITDKQWKDILISAVNETNITDFSVDRSSKDYRRIVARHGIYYQEQIVRHSGSKTYALTLTVPIEETNGYALADAKKLANCVFNNFRTWTPKA